MVQEPAAEVKASKGQILRWLLKELRKKGFEIRRDYIVELGGISHNIDVLAVLPPVTGVEVKLAFVVVDKDIEPEDIERYFSWRQEGDFDKLIIVTNGKIAIEAYELAKKFGIDLVRAGRDVAVKYAESVSEYNIYHIHPSYSDVEALEILKKLSKGFLRKKRELVGMSLVYVPFFDVDVHIRFYEEEKEVIRRIKLTFDGVRGGLVIEEGGTLRVLSDKGEFTEFSDQSLDALRIIIRDTYKSINDISMELKLSEGKVRSIANYLLHKGLVDIYQDIIEFRKSIFDSSFSIVDLLSEKNVEMHDGEPQDVGAKGRIAIYPRIDVERLFDFLGVIAKRINSMTVVYYPFYVGSIKESDGSLRKVLVDGITGFENSSLLWSLAEVESIIDEALTLNIRK